VDLISVGGAKPRAAHMWVNGLSGTYRTSEAVSAKDFVDLSISASISFFSDSIASNVEHIREFLNKYSQ
jgi:hypothetical protein